MRTNVCAAGGLLCAAVLLVFSPPESSANNLVITNVSLENVSGGAADIEFDMSWDHSWRSCWTDQTALVTITNWDAVWVFARFRQSGGIWQPAHPTASGHTPSAGTAITPSDDDGLVLGAFVYRTDEDSGSITCQNMRLHWNYTADGLLGTNDVDIAVVGVEMVYIPEGAFSLGSGGTEYGHFFKYPATNTPFVVTNEDAISVGRTNDNLYYAGYGDGSGPVSNDFPKGYRAFYCMKYEMTQGQYADFLNLLDSTVAATYYPNRYNQNRYMITNTGSGYLAETPDRACNWMNVSKILVWMDWTGLRPMTELEFEKICRGPHTPWIDEFAWGNSSYTTLTGIGGVDGSGMETGTPAAANTHLLDTVSGPVRAGIFATGSSSREEAGASYYGVMEMTGNTYEFTVGIARTDGRRFKDEYGDGDVYTAYPTSWYPPNGARAYAPRGGAYSISASYFQGHVSDRSSCDASEVYRYDNALYGCRGVRTAP